MRNIAGKVWRMGDPWKKMGLFLLVLLLLPAAVWAGTVQLPKTGQTTVYAAGDDGALQKGVAWPNPRFTNNGNGTVTDNLTGLIWLTNANCTDTAGGVSKVGGYLTWANALTWSNALASGACGLSDGSAPGDWRLPNVEELESLVDLAKYGPPLPAGHPFSNVQSDWYWSSSTFADSTYSAWIVSMGYGDVGSSCKAINSYVWPVRGGQSGSFGSLVISPSSSGAAPFTVTFTATTSKPVSQYRWDLNGDGTVDVVSTVQQISHTFTTPGIYHVNVKVLDYEGKLSQLPQATITVTASLELTGPVSFIPYYPESDGIASVVMKGGKAIRYYRIVDGFGVPQTQKAVRYRDTGTAQQINTATDNEGFVSIATDWLTSSRLLTLEILNADGSVKSDVTAAPLFYVHVTDRELEQEWTGLLGVKGSVGVGGPSAKLGPFKFETLGAGVEGGISTKTKLNYQIKGSETNVTVTNAIGSDIDLSLSAGFFGQAWGVKKRPQIDVGVTAGGRASTSNGVTLELPGFLDTSRADHGWQTLSLGTYLLETSASNLLESKGQLPVGFETLYNKALSKLAEHNLYLKNVSSETGFGIYATGGASLKLNNPLGVISGSGLTMSFFNFNTEAVFTRKANENNDGSSITSLGITSEMDISLFKLSLSRKFGDKRKKDTPEATLGNILALGTNSIEGRESITLAKDSSGRVTNLSFTTGISSSGNTYAFTTDNTEKSLTLSVTNPADINMVRSMPEASVVNNMIQGTALVLTPGTFSNAYQAAMDALITPQSWTVERADTRTFSLPLDIGLGLGLKASLGLSIEGTYAVKFEEEKGVVSAKGMLTTNQYQKDSYITDNQKSLVDFFDAAAAAVTDAISSAVETVANKVQDTVVAAGAAVKETAAGAWYNCVAYISKLVPEQKSQIIRASSANIVGEATGFIATALGDVFIVNMKDDQGNLITDFSASPLELTIEYTDIMLSNAGLSGKAAKLAIYFWDGDSGFYIHQTSIVDQANMKVTANITRPGQYILAVDEIPPAISDFQVSDGTTTPVVSATIRDPFSGIDTSTLIFSLDGTTLVNSGNWADYYDIKSGLFKYIVTTPLTAGNHTAQIAVSDTAGNSAAQSQIAFTVNNTPPVISHTPVTTSQTGDAVGICAAATSETGIQRVTLFYRPESGIFDYQSVEMAKGREDDFCASIPSDFVTSLGIRYYIRAVDVSGNAVSMPEPVVVNVTGNDVLPQVTGLKSVLQSDGLLLNWNKASAIVTAGYKVYSGEAANNLSTVSDVGNFVSVLFEGLDKTKAHYFAIAAYDGKGVEGPKSDALFFGGETLYADFTGYGLYYYEGNTWHPINSVNPDAMTASGGILYADFANYGLYKYAEGNWTEINKVHPSNMLSSDGKLYSVFDSYGFYTYESNTWGLINSVNPDKMTVSGGVLYADFASYGLYKYAGGAWSQINTVRPTNMMSSDGKLYATFAGYGFYQYDDNTWIPINSVNPDKMTVSGGVLYADFANYGLYKYAGGAWSQINSVRPTNMLSSDGKLYATFADFGFYKYDATGWKLINSVNPESMTVSGGILYPVFKDYGFYKYDGTNWTQINSVIPAKVVAGE